MIAAPVRREEILRTSDFDEFEFGVKKEGLPHLFEVLRGQLYSDPILAVIREYSVNARDAHVAAGKGGVPIRLSLPTPLEPLFKVRDFGDGLSEDEVKEVYSQYGESTKRGTNSQTGMLGLGSKCAFAYGESFTITSWRAGWQTVYSAYLDESGLGKIARLSRLSSSAPEGIEIAVPVRERDVTSWNEKAKQFFRFWETAPEAPPEVIQGSLGKTDYYGRAAEEQVLRRGAGWRILGSFGKSYNGTYYQKSYPPLETGYRSNLVALMGGVPYPIDVEQAKEVFPAHWHDLLTMEIVMEFPLGWLQFAASREALRYTDRTRKALRKRFEELKTELEAEIAAKIEKAASFWEAKQAYRKLFHGNGESHYSGTYEAPELPSCLERIAKDAVWQGLSLGGADFQIGKIPLSDLHVLRVEKKPGAVGDAYFRETANTIPTLPGVRFVKNDLGLKEGFSRPRMVTFWKRYPETKQVYVLTIGTEEGARLLKEELHLDQVEILLLSDFEPDPDAVARTKNGARDKHSWKVFAPRFNVSYGLASDHWECADLPGEGPVDEDEEPEVPAEWFYVLLDKFEIVNNDLGLGSTPGNIRDRLQALGIPFPALYGVKVAAKDRVVGKAPHFREYVEREFKKKLADPAYRQQIVDWKEVSEHTPELRRLDPALVEDPEGPMGRYLSAYRELRGHVEQAGTMPLQDIRNLGAKFGLSQGLALPVPDGTRPRHRLEPLYQEVLASYPLLKSLCSGNNYHLTGHLNREGVAHLVNLTDRARKAGVRTDSEVRTAPDSGRDG